MHVHCSWIIRHYIVYDDIIMVVTCFLVDNKKVLTINWKFKTIRISVLRDLTKIWITYILHNNNAEKLLTNSQKNKLFHK